MSAVDINNYNFYLWDNRMKNKIQIKPLSTQGKLKTETKLGH